MAQRLCLLDSAVLYRVNGRLVLTQIVETRPADMRTLVSDDAPANGRRGAQKARISAVPDFVSGPTRAKSAHQCTVILNAFQ